MLHRLSEVNTVNAIPGTVEGSVRVRLMHLLPTQLQYSIKYRLGFIQWRSQKRPSRDEPFIGGVTGHDWK